MVCSASVDLKGEAVVIENRGKGAVDLGGWKLVSEAGNSQRMVRFLIECLR